MPNHISQAENIGTVEAVMAESLSLALLNAVTQQQRDGISAEAVTIMSALEILGSITSTPLETGLEETKSKLFSAGTSPSVSALASQEPTNTEPVQTIGIVGRNAADMALQFVAQSVALSVQDAANSLRNLRTLCIAAIGRSLRQIEITGDLKTNGPELEMVQDMLAKGTSGFQQIYKDATVFLQELSLKEKSPTFTQGEVLSAPDATREAGIPPSIPKELLQAVFGAVLAQQEANITAQASTTQGIATLYSLITAIVAKAEQKALETDSTPVAPSISSSENRVS